MVATSAGGGGGGLGPGFVGIDPPLLSGLIHSLRNGVSDAQPLAASYQCRFSQLGLDTSRVTRLQQHYSWARDQQPMLQRRYNLASHQPSAQLVDGMATAGAGTLQFPTAQAAQAAGAAAAQDYLKGKLSRAQYLALLQASEGDPNWQTGAVTKLGHDGVAQLWQLTSETYPPDQLGLRAISLAVAAGMADGVTFPYSSDPLDKGTQDLQLLAPMLQYAKFPAPVLVTLGNEVTMGGPNSGSPDARLVFTALAGIPPASALFIAQFQRAHGFSLGDYVAQGSDHYGMMPTDLAGLLAGVIQAGTVGSLKTGPADAAANITMLAGYYRDHPGSHTYPEVQAVYGKIISGCWPDVSASLSDPAYAGSPGAVSVAPEGWKALIGEAMHNPPVSANLIHYSAQHAAGLARENSGNPEAQHASGLIDGVFSYEARKVYQEELASGQANAANWESQFKSQATTVAGVALSAAFDPQGVLKNVAKTAVSDAISTAVNAFGQVTPSTTLKAPSIATWQDEWQLAAAETYQQHPGLGNPQQYQQQYHCAPFLDSQGNLIQQASAAQRQAYDAWLTDPALAQASNQRFLNLDQGRLDGNAGGS